MNIDVMRKVDLWAGVPICLVLSLYRFFSQLWHKENQEPPPPSRILLIQLAETGGLVVACPAVTRLREQFPGCEVFYLTFPLGGELLHLMGIPESRRIVIRPSGLLRFVRDVFNALRTLRNAKIDTVVNMEAFARFSTIMAFLSGASRRSGFHRFNDEGRYTGSLLTHPVQYNPHLHAARSYIALVEALAEHPGCLPDTGQPLVKKCVNNLPLALPVASISLPDKENSFLAVKGVLPLLTTGHKIVLLNPNASDLVAVRRWPLARFLELARSLLEDPQVVIVLTGAPVERAQAQDIVDTLNCERVASMAGRTSLKELLALYSISSLMVTNDSGPAHFASLTKLPVLVLFGPETPRVYGPLGENVEPLYLGASCSPCISAYNQKRSPCTDNLCLKGITAQQVISRAKGLLQGEAPRRLHY